MVIKKRTVAKNTASDTLPADGTLLTARGVRSRAALLDAARSLFQSKGYANTRIADITKEAGMALGSFYNYFENKESLLEQFAQDFKAEVESQVSDLQLDEDDSYAVICELSSVYWRSCKNYAAELAAIFQASMIDKQFAGSWRKIRSDARESMANSIRTLHESGRVHNPHPEATASALGSMMDYFCYVWLIEGGEAGKPVLNDEVAIETMARVIYRTVFATAEPVD